MDEPRDDFLAGARFAGNEHGGIGRGDPRGVAQHPAPFDRLADGSQVGARRRMVEHSRPDGVDTPGPIVVDLVVGLCDRQHRHCPLLPGDCRCSQRLPQPPFGRIRRLIRRCGED